MLRSLRPVLFLIRKEFAQIFRDRVLVFQLLAPPLIQLLLVTSAATFEVRRMALHLVDRDRTPASRSLARSFAGSRRFVLARASASADAARRDLVAGDVGGVLEIPRGFGRAVGEGAGGNGAAGSGAGGGSPTVRLTFDGAMGPVAGAARSYAGTIVRRFDPGRTTATPTRASPTSMDVRLRRWFNPTADFDDYMSLGVLVILVTLVGTVLTALNLAREREQGTIEQLNVSPLTKGQFVAGKLIPFWVLGLVEVALGLLIAKAAFDVPFRGSLWLVFLAAALYLVTALGAGLLISTASRTQQQAQFLAFFLIVLYLFLSGIFTPVASMPEWGEWLAELNPMKHFLVAVRAVLLKGAGPAEAARELLVLAGFAVVTLPAAVRVYSKTAA